MSENKTVLKDEFEKHGQTHVFQFMNELSSSSKEAFTKQLTSIDLNEIDELVNKYVKNNAEVEVDFSKMAPSEYISHYSNSGNEKDWKEAKSIGEEALRAGRVAAFTVAGGQGTRLGYDGPKGTFPVSPVAQMTLFEVFAKKIAFSAQYYQTPIHWFIMTSLVNHEATLRFFEKNNYFGLNQDEVHLFSQGLMPAVDFEGRLILDAKNNLVMTPDGHGGALRALNRSGAVSLMKEKGIDVLSYFQVDNPLVKAIDPYFIGFHLKGNSEMSSKMIPKAYASEKVGHFCQYENQMMVVEYSDLPQSYQKECDENGELRFLAGSIAIHILDVNFIERIGGDASTEKLPFHKAIKKIQFLNKKGELVSPSEPNGVKFEMFAFDALPFAKNPVLIETLRSEDFSPVKNADGIDSPMTCKADQLKLYSKWLEAVGHTIECDSDGVPIINFEIDPLFANDIDSFKVQWNQLKFKPIITDGFILRP